MTGFDLVLAFVLLASAVFGFVRGFTREVTTVLAFLAAAVLAVWGLRYTGPLAAHVIHTDWMANAAAVLGLFIVAYIIFRLIGGAITRQVKQTSALSSLDRILGAGVGLVRGVVIIGAFALLITSATPAERMPAWMTGAALWPLANGAGSVLKAFAPDGLKMAKDVAPSVRDALTGGAKPGDPGYDAHERKSMDDLVEKSR